MNFLLPEQVSGLTGLSCSTLAKKRCDGSGPAFFKLGRVIKYERDDVDAWILTKRRTSTWPTATNDNSQTAAQAA